MHSLLTQLDVTQRQTSQKHTAQKDLEYNGPEHTSNTGDKYLDKAAQIEIVHFKKQRDPPGFSAFEKPFNDPSRDID